jgi:predicted CXXCH cytochrome family protein
MKKDSYFNLIRLIIVGFLIGVFHLPKIYSTELDPYPNPHNFQDKELCQQCHTQELPALTLPPVALCKKCHKPGTNDHPTGVTVKNPIPNELALDKSKKMVCHTCHDPHQQTSYPALLRMDFDDLCRLCHQLGEKHHPGG